MSTAPAKNAAGGTNLYALRRAEVRGPCVLHMRLPVCVPYTGTRRRRGVHDLFTWRTPPLKNFIGAWLRGHFLGKARFFVKRCCNDTSRVFNSGIFTAQPRDAHS